jgi:pseudouridine synthase
MADAGIGSRRACEELIERGEVRVNGRGVRTLPVLVDPSTDAIEVSGQPLEVGGAGRAGSVPTGGRRIYVMLYKPRQTVTTLSDPSGRRTVADIVRHPSGVRLYPVGRLDYDTMGLLLMTNDGELANRLTHPRYGVHKSYRAVVKGALTEEEVEKLERGVFLAERRDGKSVGVSRTAGALLKIARKDPTRTVLDITLSEGRNRQVRRMLAKAGCPVKKLVRMQMGPLKLKGVALGQWRELTLGEVQSLRKAAGMPTSSAPASKSLKKPGATTRRPAPSREGAPARAATAGRRSPRKDSGR